MLIFGVLQWIRLELFDRVLTSIACSSMVILVFYIATTATQRFSWTQLSAVINKSDFGLG